jgi:hypothetical protein
MKQAQPVVQKSSTWNVILFISLGLLLASITCLVVFVNLSHTIRTAGGKVVETFSQKEFASRKQTVDREYEIVRYTVDGKEFTGKTAVPRSGESQYVPVFYYEKFPGMAWFYKKDNANVVFSSMAMAVCALAFFYSLYRIVTRAKAVPAQPGKRPQPVGRK